MSLSRHNYLSLILRRRDCLMISEDSGEDAGVNQRAPESELSMPRRGSFKTSLIIENMFSPAGVTYTQRMRPPEKQLHKHLPVKWSRDWHTNIVSMALREATLKAVASKDRQETPRCEQTYNSLQIEAGGTNKCDTLHHLNEHEQYLVVD